jgi:hypothetical protein
MSSVSSIGGSQQQYLQISQKQTNDAQPNQAAPADAADTRQVAPAATSQAITNSSAAKTQTATSQNVKPPQIASGLSGSKSFESAATRNADGTFGPKRTLLPPLSYTLLHPSTSASTSVDLKA